MGDRSSYIEANVGVAIMVTCLFKKPKIIKKRNTAGTLTKYKLYTKVMLQTYQFTTNSTDEMEVPPLQL